MRRRLPPLKALPMFEVAARHASFSAAADELHLTHGAISRQIKALEDYLGVPLFRRLNRRVELTEAGTLLLPAVQTAFHVIETSAAQIAAGPRQGPLTVSCLARSDGYFRSCTLSTHSTRTSRSSSPRRLRPWTSRAIAPT